MGIFLLQALLALTLLGLIVAVVIAFSRLQEQGAKLERLSKSMDMLVAALRRDRLARGAGAANAAGTDSAGDGDAVAQPAQQPAAARPQATAHEPLPAEATGRVTLPYAAAMPAASSATPRTREPATPEPTVRERQPSPLYLWLRDYFTGGNLIVRVGVLVLFCGVAFLLKYAAEHSHVPIEVRLAGVAVGGALLLGFGWYLRRQRRGYALVLQGAGVGVLYLCVFAALRLYALLPATGAFALLAVIGAAAAILAVGQDSKSLAVLGAAGGFLAPVLSSTGQGSEAVLFSYFALLDVGILAIAWFKAWRELNLLAFLCTFGIGGLWGTARYQPALFAQTEFFLLLFFLMFVAIAVLFAQRRAPQLGHYVDGTLIFGTPLVVMGLQAGLMHDIPFGRAYSALGLAAFYLALAWLIQRRVTPALRLLVESFLAVGVALATLAVPLALDGHWTAATWALEGAAIFWVSLRQRRGLGLASGAGLQLAAGIAFLLHADPVPVHWLNSGLVGGVLIAVAALFTAYNASRPHELSRRYGQTPANLLLAWGAIWWFGALSSELYDFAPRDAFQSSLLALWIVSCTAAAGAARRLQWPALRVVSLLWWPAATLLACFWWEDNANLFAHLGWLLWPVAAALTWWILRVHEAAFASARLAALHLWALWLFVALGSLQLHWQFAQLVPESSSWSESVGILLPVLVLLALARVAGTTRWPIATHRLAYVGFGGAGLALVIALWSLWSNVTLDGAAAPLTYLPLLNPLDVVQGLALVELLRWRSALRRVVPGWLSRTEARVMNVALVLLGFVWLNAILLRTLHHWYGVPYRLDALMGSTLVQSALSVFWTVLALATMLIASRRRERLPWLGGATLMAIVLVKLFLVDLARVGTVARIVSFLVVGLLMLGFGYFSPVPPARAAAAADDQPAADEGADEAAENGEAT